MSNRTSLLALAAIATVATAALASTGASAAQFTVNHSGHFGSHFHPYPICSWGCGHDHDRDGWRDHDRDDWRIGFNHRYEGGSVGVASAGGSVPAAPAPSGGCLTKRELPEGSALFRDLCTQEQAESQPPGGAQGAR